MNDPLLWESNVVDWEKISVDSYKFVIEQASPPKEIFYKEVFNELTPEEGLKNLLYSEIERIQDKIERMMKSNRKRFSQYRKTLKISLLLIAVAIFVIVRAIYQS